jgi:hypothetical protein
MIYSVVFLVMFLVAASAMIRFPLSKVDDAEFVGRIKARAAAGKK